MPPTIIPFDAGERALDVRLDGSALDP